MAYLNNEANAGLRGLVLFAVDPELQGDLAEMVKQFRQSVRALLNEQVAAQAKAYANSAGGLSPSDRRRSTRRTGSRHLQPWRCSNSPPRMFDPIRIKFCRYPFTNGREALVTDYRDGMYLIRDEHKRDLWGARRDCGGR